MFTLAAYDASVDGSAALVQVNAIADTSLNIQNNNVVVDTNLNQVVAAYGLGGTGLLRTQLQAPSLAAKWYPEVAPVQAAALPAAPVPFADLRFTPFRLQPTEQLSAYITNGGAARTIVGVWFSDGPVSPVAGPIQSMRFTGTTTLTANTWTPCAITLDKQLPAGRYQLVGARVYGTSPILFRFSVSGYAWRPGGIAMPAVQTYDPLQFRWGSFGVWLEFTNVILPTLEVLATAGDTAQTGVLDLIGPL